VLSSCRQGTLEPAALKMQSRTSSRCTPAGWTKCRCGPWSGQA